MKLRKKIAILIFASTVLTALGFYVGSTDIYFEISKNLELFGKVYKEISFNYVDEVDPQEFMRAGIKGMLSKLDPYTVFIDEKNQDDIDLLTNGKYGGVGISIGVRNDKVTVIEIFEGYSAQKQGMRIGDVITKVNDNSIKPEMIDDISSLVKGEPGTNVTIKVLRSNELDTLVFNLVREEVIIKNVAYSGFYPENSNNVYIKLTNFSRSAGDEIRSTLRELKSKKNIESIILDLRGNPGGLLDVAVDICDKFLEKELLIVATKGRESASEKKYYAKEEPMVGKEKLIVLINGSSASASEIVAGAIQDHDRGIVLGTQSFGKGLVQTITPLSHNTSLKITTAKYYTPSGRCIQKVDYSKDNKVISEADSIKKDAFSTDNNRTVYSAGGITPDTTVNEKPDSDLLKDLLAKGKMFDFSDKYYYENEKNDFNRIKDDLLLSDFKKYLREINFEYESDIRKRINELTKHLNENHSSKSVEKTLQQLMKDVSGMFEIEFEENKNEILAELKVELAVRFLGNTAGIREKLKYDKQFLTALDIINNNSVYASLLTSIGNN